MRVIPAGATKPVMLRFSKPEPSKFARWMIHLHRHVVARDHLLRRHVHHDLAQTHAHHAVDAGDDPAQARGLHSAAAGRAIIATGSRVAIARATFA